jgi:hypothetical protein
VWIGCVAHLPFGFPAIVDMHWAMAPTPARVAALWFAFILPVFAGPPHESRSPADHLPPPIRQLTHFGERPDWSRDGGKILFLTKMFGDAMELDLATGHIRNLTAFYPHHGYTRALYLANGDILLSGPEVYDPTQADLARRQCSLSVLSRDGTSLPVPLGTRCSEGPAVSRTKLEIAWTEWSDPKPGGGDLATSKIYAADIVYHDGKPAFANRRLILNGSEPGFRCTMETQNFRPQHEGELIFNTYTDRGQKCDVFCVNLATRQLTRLTDSPAIYDEAEGAFPDGEHTLVECDEQHPGGPANIDLWKLALDGSGRHTRLTHFSDFPGYKASNGVVSENGRFMAFQLGHAGDAPGIGHGVFLYDLSAVPVGQH